MSFRKFVRCNLCPWGRELTMDQPRDFEAVGCIHAALRHPADYEAALGKKPEVGLMEYQLELGDVLYHAIFLEATSQ